MVIEYGKQKNVSVISDRTTHVTYKLFLELYFFVSVADMIS